jgi:hypothetical protein
LVLVALLPPAPRPTVPVLLEEEAVGWDRVEARSTSTEDEVPLVTAPLADVVCRLRRGRPSSHLFTCAANL